MTKKTKAVAALRNSTRGETAIREFANSNLTLEQLKPRAAVLLNNKELLRNVPGLTPEEQTKFLDRVDQAYPTIDSFNIKFVTALGDVCSATKRLPTSVVVSTGFVKRGTIAVASGGFTDVWRGEYNGAQVAIKAFRIYPAQNLKEAREFLWQRVPVWRRLSHENILPFRGVNMTVVQLALVYEWGQQGNISQFVASNPRASRVSLLFGVAKGLWYLHSLDIPHGDLKGANVVIDRKDRARLTDYGLAPINSDPSFTVAATPGAVGTSRWLAPEIINTPRKGNLMPGMESKSADVFAFGMFAVEVFTGKIPFDEHKNEAVVLRISQGERPDMPENAQAVGLTGEIWKLLESCWQQNPKKRPTMDEIVRRWEKFVENYNNNITLFPEEPQPQVGSTSRTRARTMAMVPRPPPIPEAPRPRRSSAAPKLRTENHQLRPMSDKSNRPRTTSEFARPGARSEIVHQAPRPEVAQRGINPGAAQPRAQPSAPPPKHKPKKGCGCIIM